VQNLLELLVAEPRALPGERGPLVVEEPEQRSELVRREGRIWSREVFVR
jgi:hypothetical protein